MEKTSLTELVRWVLELEHHAEPADDALVAEIVADIKSDFRDDSETSSELGEFIVTPE